MCSVGCDIVATGRDVQGMTYGGTWLGNPGPLAQYTIVGYIRVLQIGKRPLFMEIKA